jgi:hypothetical protein
MENISYHVRHFLQRLLSFFTFFHAPRRSIRSPLRARRTPPIIFFPSHIFQRAAAPTAIEYHYTPAHRSSELRPDDTDYSPEAGRISCSAASRRQRHRRSSHIMPAGARCRGGSAAGTFEDGTSTATAACALFAPPARCYRHYYDILTQHHHCYRACHQPGAAHHCLR